MLKYARVFFLTVYYKKTHSKTDENSEILERIKYENDLLVAYGGRCEYRVGKELEWIKNNLSWDLAKSVMRNSSPLFYIEAGKLHLVRTINYWSLAFAYTSLFVLVLAQVYMIIDLFDDFFDKEGIFSAESQVDGPASITPIIIASAFLLLILKLRLHRLCGFWSAYKLNTILKEKGYY